MPRIIWGIKNSKGNLICVLALAHLTGCGYFNSGTWEDDPKNWERAFHQRPPREIEIVHSYYWRSPHWSYEFRYFFSLRGTKEARELLFANDQMEKLGASDQNLKADVDFSNKPSWFVPKALEEYEVWTFKDEPRGNFRLFIDKMSGEIFITDYRL